MREPLILGIHLLVTLAKAQQITLTFGVEIDLDVVRRALAKHYRPGDSGTPGPSWLTFIAQAKDSLWSVDLFRCESILLHSHWVLVVTDVFTRRIIDFGIERASIDGVSACIARSRASRQRSVPVRAVPLPLHWITTVGSGTARACSHSQPLLDYDFATDRLT